jgi:hypothetical protein
MSSSSTAIAHSFTAHDSSPPGQHASPYVAARQQYDPQQSVKTAYNRPIAEIPASIAAAAAASKVPDLWGSDIYDTSTSRSRSLSPGSNLSPVSSITDVTDSETHEPASLGDLWLPATSGSFLERTAYTQNMQSMASTLYAGAQDRHDRVSSLSSPLNLPQSRVSALESTNKSNRDCNVALSHDRNDARRDGCRQHDHVSDMPGGHQECVKHGGKPTTSASVHDARGRAHYQEGAGRHEGAQHGAADAGIAETTGEWHVYAVRRPSAEKTRITGSQKRVDMRDVHGSLDACNAHSRAGVQAAPGRIEGSPLRAAHHAHEDKRTSTPEKQPRIAASADTQPLLLGRAASKTESQDRRKPALSEEEVQRLFLELLQANKAIDSHNKRDQHNPAPGTPQKDISMLRTKSSPQQILEDMRTVPRTASPSQQRRLADSDHLSPAKSLWLARNAEGGADMTDSRRHSGSTQALKNGGEETFLQSSLTRDGTQETTRLWDEASTAADAHRGDGKVTWLREAVKDMTAAVEREHRMRRAAEKAKHMLERRLRAAAAAQQRDLAQQETELRQRIAQLQAECEEEQAAMDDVVNGGGANPWSDSKEHVTARWRGLVHGALVLAGHWGSLPGGGTTRWSHRSEFGGQAVHADALDHHEGGEGGRRGGRHALAERRASSRRAHGRRMRGDGMPLAACELAWLTGQVGRVCLFPCECEWHTSAGSI